MLQCRDFKESKIVPRERRNGFGHLPLGQKAAKPDITLEAVRYDRVCHPCCLPFALTLEETKAGCCGNQLPGSRVRNSDRKPRSPEFWLKLL